MKHFRKKHYVFICDQNRSKVLDVAAVNFYGAIEKLDRKFHDLTFTLLTIY